MGTSVGPHTPRALFAEDPDDHADDIASDEDQLDSGAEDAVSYSGIAAARASSGSELQDASKSMPTTMVDKRVVPPRDAVNRSQPASSGPKAVTAPPPLARISWDNQFERVSASYPSRVHSRGDATPPSASKRGQPSKHVEVDGDMARARELVYRCSATFVLAGQSLGDHVYAASRFVKKTMNKAAAKVVDKAIKKYRVAEQISAPRLRALATDVRREAIATLADLGVEWPAVWCQELLRIAVVDRPELIAATMWPWARQATRNDASDDDADRSDSDVYASNGFDPAAPRLSSVDMPVDAMISCCSKALVECVMVPAIGNGEAGKKLLTTVDEKFCKLIAACKKNAPGMPEASHA